MSPLMASVPPLDARPVSKYAKNAVFYCRRVRPRRAISVTGQVGKVSMTRSAIRRPSIGLGCRYVARRARAHAVGSGIVEAFRVMVAWSLQILDGLSSEPQLTAASCSHHHR